MKKLIFTLMALLTMTYGANAATTLWEGTDDGSDIYIAKEKLVADATITLEFNWLDSSDGAQFSSFYYDSDWVNLYNWQWVNNGESFSFSLTQAQIDAIPERLGFKTNALTKMTFKKISIDATTVTEWEDTDDGNDIFIAKSKLIAGAPITLEFNWLGSDGAQFSCFYWDGSDWQKIHDWKWVNNGSTFTFWLTQTQIDAIPEQLGFKTEVVDKMTFKKISIFKPCVSVSIGSDEIATFSSDKDLDFSGTDVTPYYASAVIPGSVTLTPTTNATTWNYCGYILQGPEGTYDVPVTTSATYPAATYLKAQVSAGTVTASTDDKYHYIFAKKNESGEIGFYNVASDYNLKANKAYLETNKNMTPKSSSSEEARITLVFSDEQGESTDISVLSYPQLLNSQTSELPNYYNINGMQVSHPKKGIYIKNGKKIIVK